MTDDEDFNIVRTHISLAALCEQMAEECSELTQALLKKARKLREENYTPLSLSDIDSNIIEEVTDVYLCAKILELRPDDDIFKSKLKRWIERIIKQKDEAIFEIFL